MDEIQELKEQVEAKIDRYERSTSANPDRATMLLQIKATLLLAEQVAKVADQIEAIRIMNA